MKASVQYIDFTGTSAADISDHTDLKAFLEAKGIDTKKYEPIGSKFYSSYDDHFYVYFICIDHEKTDNADDPFIVTLSFESPITRDEYFNLYKRYEVISVKEFYEGHEIKAEVIIDDRDDQEAIEED